MSETSSDHQSKVVEQQKPQKKKGLNIYYIVLIVVLSGAIVYMLMEANDLRQQQRLTEAQLDAAYNDLDSMSTELDQRILKIAQLGGEIDTLIQIKNQLEEEKRAIQKRANGVIAGLNDKVEGYKEVLLKQDEEIERLKKINEELLVENTDLKNEANQLNESIRELNSDRAELENKVALASRLKIDGLTAIAISSSGKEREGQFRNRHINVLKIQYKVLENKVAPIEGKDLMLKITSPDGNVLFDVTTGSGTFMYEGRESFYTIKKNILYDRSEQAITMLYNKGTDYEVGKYKVEVYVDDYKMGSNQFIVK